MALYVYRLPSRDYFAVETGQPKEYVRTGFARTPTGAVANARSQGGETPIQSTGSDCGRQAAIAWTFSQAQEPVPSLERINHKE